MTPQITSLTIASSTVYPGAVQLKTWKLCVKDLRVENSPVASPLKGSVTRKMFPFDDVIMNRNTDWFYVKTDISVFELNKANLRDLNNCDRPSSHTQIVDFSARVPLKFDGWPRKIIGDLFYITSSFVRHLKRSVNSNWSYCPETLNLGQNRCFFVPCDFEIWWMTLKNNRPSLLCYIKLYASFQSHCWIQTGVTVRKRSIRVKIGDF